MNVDVPVAHWKWLLEEACYLVARGVRPLATVEVPDVTDTRDRARADVGDHGLLAWFGPSWGDLSGNSVVDVAVARYRWVLDLYAERGADPRVVGLLLGYSADAIADHCRSAPYLTFDPASMRSAPKPLPVSVTLTCLRCGGVTALDAKTPTEPDRCPACGLGAVECPACGRALRFFATLCACGAGGRVVPSGAPYGSGAGS